MIVAPYVMFLLDGPLAVYAGVDPRASLGAPLERGWALVDAVMARGYRVVVLTWRDPGTVNAWIEEHAADTVLGGSLRVVYAARRFEVTREMPMGVPHAVVFTARDLAALAVDPALFGGET